MIDLKENPKELMNNLEELIKILGRAYNKNLDELIDLKETNSKSWYITWNSWWREKDFEELIKQLGKVDADKKTLKSW